MQMFAERLFHSSKLSIIVLCIVPTSHLILKPPPYTIILLPFDSTALRLLIPSLIVFSTYRERVSSGMTIHISLILTIRQFHRRSTFHLRRHVRRWLSIRRRHGRFAATLAIAHHHSWRWHILINVLRIAWKTDSKLIFHQPHPSLPYASTHHQSPCCCKTVAIAAVSHP